MIGPATFLSVFSLFREVYTQITQVAEGQCFHTETRRLICTADQLACIKIMGTWALDVLNKKSCDKISNYELWKNDIPDDTLNSVQISCKRRTRYLHKLSGKQRVKKRKVSSSKSQSIWDALLSTFSYLKSNETTDDTLVIPGEIEDDIEFEFCSKCEGDAADNWAKGEKGIQNEDCREAQEIYEQDPEVKVPKTYKDLCVESQIMAIPCKTESFIDYEANDTYFDCE